MLDLALAGRLDFEEPDLKQYPCLKLSFDALRSGQGACIALNAANEIAVAGFLSGALAYTEIASVIDAALDWQAGVPESALNSLDDVMALDALTRQHAKPFLRA